MALALASADDIQVHLPADKLIVSDDDAASLQKDVLRIIRGYLAGVFEPTVLASWVSPATTPELIRSIAGRLIASFYYARRYSEDDTDVPEYAQSKYNEAIAMLTRIAAGTLVLLDAAGTTTLDTTTNLSTLDFYPRDDTNRAFSMGDVY